MDAVRYSGDPSERARLLADSSRMLFEAGLGLDEIMQSLCRACVDSLCDFAVIFSIAEDGETFGLAAQADHNAERMAAREALLGPWKGRVGEGLTGRVAASGEALYVPVVDQEQAQHQVPEEHRQHVIDVPTYSYIIAPVKARNRVFGTLTVGRTVPGHPLSEEDLDLIKEMALRTALMMEGAEEHRRTLREAEQRIEIQTRLTDSEARYRTLSELSPLAIFVNQGGAWAYANPAAAELLGASSPGELLGRSPREFIHPDFHAAAAERSRRVLEYGAANPPLEQYWLRLDGSRFDCEVTSAPISWEGEPAVLLVCHDITERKQAEQAVIAASKLKDEFLGLVSHELRTPLTTIYGYASLLKRNPTLPQELVQESLGDLLSEAERLNRIVENMLVLGRIEAGQVLDMEPLSLGTEISEIVDKFRKRHPDADVRTEGEPQTVVMGVQEYLDQVIQNLLTNAYKYSPEGAAITVSTEQRDGCVWVCVSDRGRGVEDASAIFDAFVRESGAQGLAGGLGLGLTVCKRLVGAMGGTISVAPRDGGGTTFSFSLQPASMND